MSHFACRPFLRDALAAAGALSPTVQAHVDGCAFCQHRLQASSRLVPHLRQRPRLSPAAAARLAEGVWERIVEQAEGTAFVAALMHEVPKPAAGLDGWPEPLLESDVARRAVAAPSAVAAASWERVKTSILDQVAGSRGRRHRHWWLGLLGTAVAAGIVLVVVHGGGQEPPRITFRDIASLPGADVGGSSQPAGMPVVDFAVIRRGAPR